MNKLILPQHVLSRFMGFLAERSWGKITHTAIRAFIKYYQVDLSEAVEPDYRSYSTFNKFFTRYLKKEARPVSQDAQAIVSPVDGVVSEVGCLSDGQLLQAKQCYYQAASLLGGQDRAKPFYLGNFLTAYLAPKNYHRIHMPLAGRLLEMVHIPGRLFSVNAKSVQRVPQLFTRNERVICLFETQAGLMAMVMVGALIVGNIATVWHGVVTPPTSRSVTVWDYRTENKIFARGEEIGHFKLGSTVILLFPPHTIQWDSAYRAGHMLRLGEKIGNF